MVRGLVSFDSTVNLGGSEEHYTSAIEFLTSHFLVKGWTTVIGKSNVVRQHRTFVTKLRTSRVDDTTNWFHFLASDYKLQSRSELHQIIRYASLSLPPWLNFFESFVVPIPELDSDKETFKSCIHSLQVSYAAVPNVSSLYRDSRSVSRVFRPLRRGQVLIRDKNSPFGIS